MHLNCWSNIYFRICPQRWAQILWQEHKSSSSWSSKEPPPQERNQCDQIGRFLKVLVTNFLTQRAQTFGYFLGYFKNFTFKLKTSAMSTFWATFGKKLSTSRIWKRDALKWCSSKSYLFFSQVVLLMGRHS